MLNNVLTFLTRTLDRHVRNAASQDALVLLASLSDRGEDGAPDVSGKLALTLVNIEREAAAPTPTIRKDNDLLVKSRPPLHLNLFLLVSAAAATGDKGYEQALGRLGRAMEFFQSNATMTAQSMPEFPDGLDRLTVEFVNLDMQSLNYLWGNLGGRYVPSALYKIRMLTIQPDQIVGDVQPILRIGAKTKG
ncbi:MAG: DUF4255 domain-containing protein [Paracoccaceae bacterium]|nr:DUF4255 domain-containing protein [Paracoccaceae bacterium]